MPAPTNTALNAALQTARESVGLVTQGREIATLRRLNDRRTNWSGDDAGKLRREIARFLARFPK